MRRFVLLISLFEVHVHAAGNDAGIYGGISAGIRASVQTKRLDKSVIVVCPDKHHSGSSGGGLGFTDTNHQSAIGGMAREDYPPLWEYYDGVDARKWQKKKEYVITQNEPPRKCVAPDSVDMKVHGMDSHKIQHYITLDEYVRNDADIGVGIKRPCEMSFESIVPKRSQADNLLVPVCASATHIADDSIHMEAVFMILGKRAATAVPLAIDTDDAIQDLPFDRLRTRRLKEGRILLGKSPPFTHEVIPKISIRRDFTIRMGQSTSNFRTLPPKAQPHCSHCPPGT